MPISHEAENNGCPHNISATIVPAAQMSMGKL
jgi:hypothetical protein